MLKQRRTEGDKYDVEWKRKSNNKKMVCMCVGGGGVKNAHTQKRKKFNGNLLENVYFAEKCDEMKTAIFPIRLVLHFCFFFERFSNIKLMWNAFLCNIQTKSNEECMLSQFIELNRFSECDPSSFIFLSIPFTRTFEWFSNEIRCEEFPAVVFQTINSLILKMHTVTSYRL